MAARRNSRDQIVEAALAVLAEDGLPGFSAAALAARAGVSKATLFHHFESLDDIVVAALERFLMSMPAMSPAPGTPLRDWLIALGVETVAATAERPREAAAYLAFVAKAQADERLRARLLVVAEAAEQAFSAAIRQLAPGRFDAAEIGRIATLILMAGDGLALHRTLFPSRAPGLEAAWMALVDAIAPKEELP